MYRAATTIKAQIPKKVQICIWMRHFNSGTETLKIIIIIKTKGQLISKWFFGVSQFFQKMNGNNSDIMYLDLADKHMQVRFG